MKMKRTTGRIVSILALLFCVIAPATFGQCYIQSWALRPGFYPASNYPDLDYAISQEALNISSLLNVGEPELWYFDDSSSPNCFASPIDIPRQTYGPTVYLGFNLLFRTFSTPGQGSYAFAGIMAHEFGHILQFQNGIQQVGKSQELQADFLAGYYLARKTAEGLPVNIASVANSLFMAGDTAFSLATGHGTGPERVSMMGAGFRSAGLNPGDAFQFGIEMVNGPLKPPFGIIASSVYSDKITLQWSSPGLAEQFVVQSSPDASFLAPTVVYQGSAASTTLTRLPPGRSYFFRVQRVFLPRVSAWSLPTKGSTLTSNVKPQFTLQPHSEKVSKGSSVTFSAEVIGSPVPKLVWLFNNKPLLNATSATLQLNNIVQSQVGSYSLVASNSSGVTTSSVAVLTLILPAPGGFSATRGLYADRVELNWLAIDGAYSYLVFRSETSDFNSAVNIVNLGAQGSGPYSYEDIPPKQAVDYYYWVQAFVSGDRGILSPPVVGRRGEGSRGEIGFANSGLFSKVALRESAGTFAIELQRSGGSDGPVSVRVKSGDLIDTATPAVDYVTIDTIVPFGSGEVSKTINVTVRQDTSVEGSESFALWLSEPQGGVNIDANKSFLSVSLLDDNAALLPPDLRWWDPTSLTNVLGMSSPQLMLDGNLAWFVTEGEMPFILGQGPVNVPAPITIRLLTSATGELLDRKIVSEVGVTGVEGETYFIGSFTNTGTFLGQVLTSNGGRDGYIGRVSASGQVEWLIQTKSANDEDCTLIIADNHGGTWVSGMFKKNLSFGGKALHTTELNSSFVAHLDRAGRVLMLLPITSKDRFSVSQLAMSTDDNVFLTGSMSDPVNSLSFGDASSGAITQKSGAMWLAKISPTAGFIWVQSSTGGDFVLPSTLAIRPDGSLIVGGKFLGSFSYGGISLTNVGSTVIGNELDGFVLSINPDGTAAWSKVLGTADFYGDLFSIAVASDGAIYVAGSFAGLLEADGFKLPSLTRPDGYLAILEPTGRLKGLSHLFPQGVGSPVNASLRTFQDGRIFLSGSRSVSQGGGLTAFIAEIGSPLIGIEIVPKVTSLHQINEKSQLRAVAHLKNGTQIDPYTNVVWTVADSSVATIDVHGLVTAKSTGTTLVHVTSGERLGIVGESTVTFSPLVVPLPVISPTGGTFGNSVDVTIVTPVVGSTIYYSSDGSSPTTNAIIYRGPITLTSTATIKAFAVKSGYTDSQIAVANFSIAATPVASVPSILPNGGAFKQSVEVVLKSTTPRGSIRYTIDGTAPTSSSTLYTGPFVITNSTTLRAISVRNGYTDSPVASARFTKAGASGSDFNLDGATDILFANPSTRLVSIWLMAAQTLNHTNLTLGFGGTGWTVAGYGRFTPDGNNGILWQNSFSGQVGVWSITPKTFGIQWSVLGVTGSDWKTVGIRDVNHDGSSDILWTNRIDSSVGIWLSQAGKYIWSTLGTVGADWNVAGLGDFDGNGGSDLLWRNSKTGDVGTWLLDDVAGFSWRQINNANADWRIAGADDFDNDGTSDVLLRNASSGEVGIWYIRNGTFQRWELIGTAALDWEILGTGDFDSDGSVDILWSSNATGELGAWLRNSLGIKWSSFGTIQPGSTVVP